MKFSCQQFCSNWHSINGNGGTQQEFYVSTSFKGNCTISTAFLDAAHITDVILESLRRQFGLLRLSAWVSMVHQSRVESAETSGVQEQIHEKVPSVCGAHRLNSVL